jgi:hypothetical protein
MTICEWAARGRGLAVVAALLVTVDAPRAKAQAEEDQAAARALLTEARKMMKEGAYDKACPKLEAASKLYPGSGVLLNLGDCFEHAGRLASAWTVFGEAGTRARTSSHPEDEVEAKRRQSLLERRLQRIAIHVVKDAPALVVKRDGTVVDRGAWDTALPVDPGVHTVTAEAAGRAPWTTHVTTSQPGQTLTVEVPELSVSDATASTPPPSAPRDAAARGSSYWTTRRIAGLSLLGAGVVGVGVAGILGLVAKSEYSTAEGESGAAQRADSASAVKGGDAATVVMVVGGVVAATGLVVWLTAPSASVSVGTTGRQVLARWTF